MLDKMKQLMALRQQAETIKRELEAMRVEINDVDGIRIVIDGAQNFHEIRIDEELLKQDGKGALEADLLRAVRTATKRVQEVAAQKMAAAMPNIS